MQMTNDHCIMGFVLKTDWVAGQVGHLAWPGPG